MKEITNNIRLSDCVDESEVKQTEQLRFYDLTDIWVSLEVMNEVGNNKLSRVGDLITMGGDA